MRRTSLLALPLGAVLLAGCQTAETEEPVDAPSSPVEVATAPESPTAVDTASTDPSADAPDDASTDAGLLPAEGEDPIPTASANPEGEDVLIDAQGNVLKLVGETAGLLSDDGAVLFEITVRSITWADSCPSRAGGTSTPERDGFLVLDVAATLAEEYAQAAAVPDDPFVPIVADFFTAIDEDGASLPSQSDAAFVCYDAELITPFVEPGQTAEGLIVLDPTSATSAVLYDPFGSGGWAWQLPNG